MKKNIDVLLQEYDDNLHVVMKCKCCGFQLTYLIEDAAIRIFLSDIIDNMSLIFDEKKKG